MTTTQEHMQARVTEFMARPILEAEDYLADDQAFILNEEDVRRTFVVAGNPDGQRLRVMAEIAYEDTEMRSALKQRGYQWFASEKRWAWINDDLTAIDAECAWLLGQGFLAIYNRGYQPIYRAREINVPMVSLFRQNFGKRTDGTRAGWGQAFDSLTGQLISRS